LSVRCATLNLDIATSPKNSVYARLERRANISNWLKWEASERKLAPMTVSSPNVIEIKLDRLIDDMRLLRSQMIAFDRHLKGIEACLKPSEPSEQQPESKSRSWFAALASATTRTVLFAVGAATGAGLLYLGTSADSATAISASMSIRP
jgi:hypothetical protein